MLRKLLVVVVVGLLPSLPGPVGAQGQLAWAPAVAAPVNIILFVGNSLFHGKYQPVLAYNAAHVTDENYGLPATDPRCETTTGESVVWGGIPGIFQQFTEEAGPRYEVHFEEINARPLQYHYEHALSIIQQPRWNTVVLQEHSVWALPPRCGGHPEQFRDYATRLERAVHAASPAASVFLFQTWPRRPLLPVRHALHRPAHRLDGPRAARGLLRFAGAKSGLQKHCAGRRCLATRRVNRLGPAQSLRPRTR